MITRKMIHIYIYIYTIFLSSDDMIGSVLVRQLFCVYYFWPTIRTVLVQIILFSNYNILVLHMLLVDSRYMLLLWYCICCCF